MTEIFEEFLADLILKPKVRLCHQYFVSSIFQIMMYPVADLSIFRKAKTKLKY